MPIPLKTCSWRSAVAVLGSGAVISMSALSGGVAPAFAKPGGHGDPGIPVIPTPTVVVPEAPAVQEQAPAEPPPAPKDAPAPAPKEAPAPAKVETPPQQPAPAPEIAAPAPEPAPQPQAPAPQLQAPAPPKKETPRVVEAPKADAPKVEPPKADVPQIDAPKASAPRAEAPKVQAPQADSPQIDVPRADTPRADTPRADPPKVDDPAPLPAVAPPGDAKHDAQVPPGVVSGQTPEGVVGAPDGQGPPAVDQPKPGADGSRVATDDKQSAPSTVSKAAQRIPTAQPDTMEAPEQDIEFAKQAKPVEVKPEPAKKNDVDFLSSAINVDSKTKLGPFESDFRAGSEFSIGDRDRDRDWDRDRDHDWDRDRDHDRDWDWDKKQWDRKVRQWDRRWVEYDDWYRPVFCNPYRAPVRIVYLYERAPRIVIVPPLGRAVIDAAALAAYSFTAVVLNGANLAADVAVGTFFGGGYIPPLGAPFAPPPPLLRYDNVPVQVRYSNATYQPFRVNQIVDVGDDVQYGGRKVLLDGATPAWGQWTTSPTGERQFEVHRTQPYPGLGDPQEAPLPGDYRMQLASDESAGGDRTQLYLTAAAGVVAGLGIAALALAFFLGRRRLQP
jgi:hypothetical protein